MIPQLFPNRSLYVYGVAIASIIAFAMLWFGLSQIFEAVRAIGVANANYLKTNDTTYTTVDTFLSYINQYILIILLLALIIWAFVYSQKRGYPIVEG